MKRARASVDYKVINEYFDKLETILNDIKPEAIINFVETNIMDDLWKTQVISRLDSNIPID